LQPILHGLTYAFYALSGTVMNVSCIKITNKKSELMLMRRATASFRTQMSWSISSLFQRKFTLSMCRSLKYEKIT